MTLLFRPLGAVIFGLLSDRYGRKWPLIADLLICGALSLGTAYVKTFGQFLAVRCLFGIAMGVSFGSEPVACGPIAQGLPAYLMSVPQGIWGLSAALGLENMPVEARGLFSGILQQVRLLAFVPFPLRIRPHLSPLQGYAVGYLIAAVLNLTEVAKHDDWRVRRFCPAKSPSLRSLSSLSPSADSLLLCGRRLRLCCPPPCPPPRVSLLHRASRGREGVRIDHDGMG